LERCNKKVRGSCSKIAVKRARSEAIAIEIPAAAAMIEGRRLLKLLARFRKEGLLRDTTHLSIGLSLRLVIQAAYFVLIARSLGPGAFGAFVAVVSMAAVLGPFSGMGTPNLFIKNVRSGKRDADVCWGNGLLLTLLSGSLFSIFVLAINAIFRFKSGYFVVIVVCISDLILMKITELASFGFAASNRMAQTSIQSVVVSLLRLSGIAILMAVTPQVMLHRWVLVYLLTSFLGTVYAVWKGSQLWGMPSIDLPALRDDVAEGIFFSIGSAATTVYNDIDKIMLSKLSDLASTGVYAAAYRVVDVSLTPVRSLVSAAYPQFFRKGVGGMRAVYPYALSLIAKAAPYGVFATVSLWLCAPVLPLILGSKYEAVVPALRWLALIPLLRCFHVFLADSLSGAGLQRIRTGIQAVVALLNIGLNMIILPRWSWRGAAWTSLGCDGLLVVVFWLAALYYLHRQAPIVAYASPMNAGVEP
jgi:O-antigen/teichoic acid export membrane protein